MERLALASALFNARGASREASEVVKARSTHYTASDDLYTFDVRGVEHKRSLHANLVSHPSYGK